MIKIAKNLKKRGVLSINQRNSDFLLRYNARKYYPRVDNKLETKKMAIAAGLSVPKLYDVISREQQIQSLETLLKPYNDFVIKPAHGAQGDGILVIKERVLDEHFRHVNGQILTIRDLSYHLSCLLSGSYSLGGHPDKAIIERRVVVDPVFNDIIYEGVPDIRIIVLLGYPAMAMLRLPTRISGGRGNLHQGAIGAGIDIATGVTLGGVFHNDPIERHPDTLMPIANIRVPFWDKILEIAANCYEMTQLGHLGVDIVLDKDEGPLILELNARPGLNIQIANRDGLLHRYRNIEARSHAHTENATARVNFAQGAF